MSSKTSLKSDRLLTESSNYKSHYVTGNCIAHAGLTKRTGVCHISLEYSVQV